MFDPKKKVVCIEESLPFLNLVSKSILQCFRKREHYGSVKCECLCASSATLDGGLGLLLPMQEKTYRRLLMLQNALNTMLPHHAGLNPKAFRYTHAKNLIKEDPGFTVDIFNSQISHDLLSTHLLLSNPCRRIKTLAFSKRAHKKKYINIVLCRVSGCVTDPQL